MQDGDIEKRKEDLQKCIDSSKAKRDTLNKKTKELREKGDELNAQVKKNRKEGVAHKKRRDDINKRVANIKKKREELHKQYRDAQKKIRKLRMNLFSKDEDSLDDLEKEIDKLEFKQMTQQLNKREEEKLVEHLLDVYEKLRKSKEKIENYPDLQDAIKEKERVKEKADKEHKKIEKLSSQAQEEHSQMIESFKKSDELWKNLNKIQKEFVLTRLDADKAHKEVVEYIKEFRETEEKISERKRKEKIAEKRKERDEVQKKADEIFERFKKGEKLSTEDLMVLQKAGLI